MIPPRSIAGHRSLHQTAIISAKNLAIEHRNLLKFEPGSHFPPPGDDESAAYAVLLTLRLVSPDNYQWTEFGISMLNQCDEDLTAFFTQHLDEVLFPVDERPTIPIQAGFPDTASLQAVSESKFRLDSFFRDVTQSLLPLKELPE